MGRFSLLTEDAKRELLAAAEGSAPPAKRKAKPSDPPSRLITYIANEVSQRLTPPLLAQVNMLLKLFLLLLPDLRSLSPAFPAIVMSTASAVGDPR